MHSHLVTLVVFSAMVSIVFATLLRDTTRERLRFGPSWRSRRSWCRRS
jgi:hypothetical protein